MNELLLENLHEVNLKLHYVRIISKSQACLAVPVMSTSTESVRPAREESGNLPCNTTFLALPHRHLFF